MGIKKKKEKGGLKMYLERVKLYYLEGQPVKYRLHAVRGDKIKEKEIVEYAANAAHVPKSAVLMAQEALFDAILYYCQNGHAVQVPYLGTFSLQMNSEVKKTAKEANAKSFTQRRIRFYPKADLKHMCSRDNIEIEVKDIFNLKKK